MSVYTFIVPVHTLDGTGAGSGEIGIQPCVLRGISIRVRDNALGVNNNVKVESISAGVSKTVYQKTIGATSVPMTNISEQFLNNAGVAVTTNVWFPIHTGDLKITVSGGGVASTTGLDVIIAVSDMV